jgi:hypothetical protein
VVDKILWPEYFALMDALDEHMNEGTERIIREELYRDSAEATNGPDDNCTYRGSSLRSAANVSRSSSPMISRMLR